MSNTKPNAKTPTEPPAPKEDGDKKIGLGATLLVVAAFAGIAYASSSTFREWVHHPLWMYDCKVVRKMPDFMCSIGASFRERRTKKVEPIPAEVQVRSLRGEWFQGANGARELKIKGRWRNTSDDEVIRKITCVATLDLRFKDAEQQKSFYHEQFTSSGLCGETGLSSGSTRSFRTTESIIVGKAWLDRNPLSASLRIELSTRTSRKSLNRVLVDEEIRLPSFRRKFGITYNN